MDNVTNISLRERVKQWLASYHKTLRDKRKKEGGFTLVELMVVERLLLF